MLHLHFVTGSLNGSRLLTKACRLSICGLWIDWHKFPEADA